MLPPSVSAGVCAPSRGLYSSPGTANSGPPALFFPRTSTYCRPMQNAAQEASVENDDLPRIRHSLAHVLAQAVVELRPGATLGFGPAIADGFYYDFVLP